MTIRRLTTADAIAYRALMLEAYSTIPIAFGTTAREGADYPLSWWESRTSEAPNAACMVMGALDGEHLAGAAGLLFESRERARHRCTLFGMYVRPGARGHGLGRELLLATLGAASERHGVRVVQLSAIDGNDAAIRLYERCGFVRYGLEPRCFAVEGGFLSRVHLWREV